MVARKIVISSEFVVRRLILAFLCFVFLLLTTNLPFWGPLPTVHAQTPSYAPLPSNISPTSPIFTDLIMQNTFHTFSCLMTGSSVIDQPCLTYISGVAVLSKANLSGGALGTATSLIGMLYLNPPVRTASYLASVGQGLGIVKVANAQVAGSGAGVLDPILKLWQVSRNIAYLVMIIIFVIIGLMVMFRQRINPQTVITAQAALPGLVIGLILITFSYFLAALLTDTAFIGTNLVGYYFTAAQPGAKQENLVQKTSNENVLTITGKLMDGITKDDIASGIGGVFDGLETKTQVILRTFAAIAAYQVGSALGPTLGSMLAMIGCGVALIPALTFIPALPILGVGGIAACSSAGSELANVIGGPAVGGTFAAYAAINPSAAIGFALWIIAIAVIIYTMFKLLLRLINSFLTIIFLTITAPFQFLAASLPGRQGIATGWILNMLCNVLAFPAVMAVFYFVAYILGSTSASGQLFGITAQTSITNNQTLPLFGKLNLGFINVLLAFGALLATPTIPDIICRAIGRVGQAGQLIGQGIGGNISGGRGYFGQAQGGLGKISNEANEFRDQPEYRITGYKDGKPIYEINPFASRAGRLGKLSGWGKRELWKAPGE